MITNKLYLKFILTEKDYCIFFMPVSFHSESYEKCFILAFYQNEKRSTYLKSLLILVLQVFYANICMTFYTCKCGISCIDTHLGPA